MISFLSRLRMYGRKNAIDLRCDGSGLNGTDFTTAAISLTADTTAAVGEGPAIIFGGATGNGVTPYVYGFLQATKDSATAGDYTAGFRFASMNSVGGPTQGLQVTGAGNVVLGKSNVAAAATEGWVYIPIIVGPPTGTPLPQTGFVPLAFQATANTLWVWNGTTWTAAILNSGAAFASTVKWGTD